MLTADLQKSITCRILFLTLLLLVVYGNTLNHGFVWDDINIILDSPLTESLRNIPKFFVSEDIAEGPTGYYRPITYVSFAIDRAIWGNNPIGFNITNLLLHILVVVTFYRLVAVLFKKENLAFIAALLFALHPLVGETVNFHAGGRNTLLCALFTLLSLLFYTKKKLIPSLICFMLAIFSKEFALLLPALFFLYDKLIAREKIRPAIYALYFLAIICYLSLRSYSVAVNANLLTSMDFSVLWIMPKIFGSYLINMFFPVGIKTMYDVDKIVTWSSFLGYSLLLATLIVVAVILRKQREIIFAVVIFFLFLLPVSNLFSLGSTMMADRYAYFPLFGFCLGSAWLISFPKKKWITASAIIVITLLFSIIDFKRNSYWKDEISLFSQMIKNAPGMSIGFQNLGYAYFDKRDYPNAEKYLTIAYAKKDVNSRMLVGSAFMFQEMGKLEKAIIVLNKKIEMEPGNSQSYIMLSKIYEQIGNSPMAKQFHDKAVKLSPGIYEVMEKRAMQVCRDGEELMGQRKFVAAERLFKEALTIDANFVPALINMGWALFEKGEHEKGIEYLKRAIKLEPENVAAHYNLATVYEELGKKAEANAEMDLFKKFDAKRVKN